MKSTMRAKLLQHFLKKKQAGGFTLIELLVVIIIIGILAAIALPSFLNQANKAKQSEAKAYVGSINRAQQAYFLENNKFAPADFFSQLGLGIDTTTTNYTYSVSNVANTFSYGAAIADPVGGAESALKAYVGVYKVGTVEGTGEATTLAALCEAIKAPIEGGADPTAVATLSNANIAGTLTAFGLGAAGDATCDTAAYKNLGG